MIQTKRDALVLQVGGWARGWRPLTVKRHKCLETWNQASDTSTERKDTNVHPYINTYIHAYIYTYIYKYTLYIHIHTYIHTYIYIYIHTLVHTYIHTVQDREEWRGLIRKAKARLLCHRRGRRRRRSSILYILARDLLHPRGCFFPRRTDRLNRRS
jgi:hypothetical protein